MPLMQLEVDYDKLFIKLMFRALTLNVRALLTYSRVDK